MWAVGGVLYSAANYITVDIEAPKQSVIDSG